MIWPAPSRPTIPGRGSSRSEISPATRPAADVLRVGDMVVRVGGELVTRAGPVEAAAQSGAVDLDVIRAGAPLSVRVETPAAPAPAADRIVIWSGAMLQEVPVTLARQRGLPRMGVYVAGRWRGSPSDRHRLGPTRRIVALDGQPTPDLDAFLAAIAAREGAASVRLHVVDLDGKTRVLTLEPDLHYWPTQELRRGPEGWIRSDLTRPEPAAAAPAVVSEAVGMPEEPPEETR